MTPQRRSYSGQEKNRFKKRKERVVIQAIVDMCMYM